LLPIDNPENYPENDYPEIYNPDGENIVPIIEDSIFDGNEDGEYIESTQWDRNPLARGDNEPTSNLMLYGLIGVAILVIIAAAFYQMKKKA